MKRSLSIALLALAACGPGATTPDDSGGGGIDGATRPDAEPPPPDAGPDLGEACDTSADCPGGFCVEGPDGDVCTYGCTDGCPEGWSCRIVQVDGDLVSVCVPVVVRVCEPCTDDEQCAGGACVELSDGHTYCVASCFEGGCPDGSECVSAPDDDHGGRYCIPEVGCSCTADNEGAIRTCENGNGFGTCYGVEHCDPEIGWTGCDAPTAELEVCDGIDNDCDALIDDGVEGGDACSNDNQHGSCPGVTLCTGADGIVCQGDFAEAEICNYTDDDCDTGVDEGFTGLGDVCSDGVGACERFGVVQCTGDGSGTACSATEGTGSDELCNAIDDDCDGPVDEEFPTLGDPCSAGYGICERLGAEVCAEDGDGTVCSAEPGPPDPPEVCNLLDDDCDDLVDEGFVNPGTGQYDGDTACGSCDIDCTVLYDLPNADGVCDTSSGQPICEMACDPGAFDLNGAVDDGCEFLLEEVIYVSTSDPAASDVGACGLGPVGTGAGHYPCETIAVGIARAIATTRTRILVANGIYDEAVAISSGRSLYGGYRWDTWERDVEATDTQITGSSTSGAHRRTVVATNISSPTELEGFVVIGAVNGASGGNSYGIYVSNSPALTLRSNQIFAGRGGPGSTGGLGGAGLLGNNGGGRPGSDPNRTYDVKQAIATTARCASGNNRQHTNGGVRSCGGTSVNGGRGGGNDCPLVNFDEDNDNTFNTNDRPFDDTGGVENSAVDGLAGAGPGAGAGGDAGDDMQLETLTCWVDPGTHVAVDGGDGADGADGGAVAGCAATAGTVSGGHWVGGAGTAGVAGTHGGGGGGGGAGGGSFCDDCPDNGADPDEEHDWLGGHGGGGGSGGCAGAGGGAAGAGGGTFGIFVVSGAAPVIEDNTIFRGEGGRGGTGGIAGAGGDGGVGGDGGTVVAYGANDGSHCAEPGGRGGNGGDGGHGSGGGGGCGGNSYGIFTSGVGNPNYCAGNTVTAGSGAAGLGGNGGYSIGNVGGNGAPGVLATCVSL
jgi:hypothetical protein